MAGYIGSKAVTLSTTAADVTGDATINGNLTVKGTTVTIDSAAAQEIRLGDNDKLTFGDATGGDLQIYHDGFNSYIDDAGTGGLIVRADNFYVRKANDVENMIIGSADGAVTLYHDNATKLATTATGIDVTGTVNSDAFSLNAGSQVSSVGTFYLDIDSDNNSTGAALNITSDNKAKFLARFQEGGDISFYEDTGTTPKFFWDASAESLGIGTSSVHADLHLGAASPHIDIGPSAGNRGKVGFDSNNVYIGSTSGTGEIHFKNNIGSTDAPHSSGDTKMVITDSGVGIGTSSPSSTFRTSIYGDGSSIIGGVEFRNAAAGGSTFTIGHASATSASATLNVTDAANLIFKTSNTEAMRIDSSGNVMIGGTSYGADDCVSINANGYIDCSANNTAGYFNRESSDGEIVRFLKGNSAVGSIGTQGGDLWAGTGDTGLYFWDGSDAIAPWNTSGNALRGSSIDIGTSGAKFKDGYFSGTVNAANFNTTSDVTLKTNVETLTGSLDAVKALRGVSYDWIENGNSEVGVIAQEVEEVIPDVVSTNDQGIKSVKYGNLVGVLIEAIKEQQAQIDELKAQLNS